MEFVKKKMRFFLFESCNNHGVQSKIVPVIFAITDRLIQCKDFNQQLPSNSGRDTSYVVEIQLLMRTKTV